MRRISVKTIFKRKEELLEIEQRIKLWIHWGGGRPYAVLLVSDGLVLWWVLSNSTGNGHYSQIDYCILNATWPDLKVLSCGSNLAYYKYLCFFFLSLSFITYRAVWVTWKFFNRWNSRSNKLNIFSLKPPGGTRWYIFTLSTFSSGRTTNFQVLITFLSSDQPTEIFISFATNLWIQSK